MSGLDKMKARILEEAEVSAQEILAKADAEADALLKTSGDAARAEAEKILGRARRGADEYAKRVESAIDMKSRQAFLAAKQQVIGDVLEKAYRTVLDLGDREYFEMLGKMLGKYALPQDGVICFSAKDLGRMPDTFAAEVKKAAESKGGSLAISDRPEEIEGGFLLKYGGIEENCTIKAVFDSMRDELSDHVNRLLFG